MMISNRKLHLQSWEELRPSIALVGCFSIKIAGE